MELGQSSFDVVLSDINMPNLDGLKLIEMLALKDVDVPPVFLTAESTSDVEAQVLQEGAADFIRTPISRPVLWGRLQNVLRRAAPAAGG